MKSAKRIQILTIRTFVALVINFAVAYFVISFIPSIINIRILLYFVYVLICTADVFLVFRATSAKEQLIMIICTAAVFIGINMIKDRPEIFRAIMTAVLTFGIAGIMDLFFGDYVVPKQNMSAGANTPQDTLPTAVGSTDKQDAGEENSTEDNML